MVRIDGTDADAIGQQALDFHFHDSADGLVNEEDIWQVLSTIFDPEIPVNIVSLGLVYACDIIHRDGQNVVQIRMTLTSPTSGMGSVLNGEGEDRLGKECGTGSRGDRGGQ